jgi:hypothetical protein
MPLLRLSLYSMRSGNFNAYFVDCASRYNCLKINQLDAQLIISIRQPLHVWGISLPIIRKYNRMQTTVGAYYSYTLL